MKKKTYKRIQNRLYREIKRRMLLEHAIAYPPKVCIEQRKVDTLKVCHRMPRYINLPEDEIVKVVKRDLVSQIADKLQEDGYIEFYAEDRPPEAIFDENVIQARIRVVRPGW